MNKREYVVYYPQTGHEKRVLVNPEHLRQLAIVLLSQSAMNGHNIICIRYAMHDGAYTTALIATYENDNFKFWYKDEEH